MTVDSAQAWLWVTVALTFTASTSFFLLHVYVRRKFVHWNYWKWSDWLNVLAYVFGVAFWILITIGLSCGLGRDASSADELDTREAALTFLLSQVSALISVGTGRLASAVLLSEVLERQSEWRLAGLVGYCLCGLWTLAEAALATGGCTYDIAASRFVCPAESSRWLAITVVDACLEVCLTTARIVLILRRRMHWSERLAPCATSSSRLLVPALTIWRFFAHADFLRDGGRGVNPALTAMLNGFLILAAIFATALPVIIKMQRRHSSEHELETGPGQNETPSIAQQTALRVGEEVDVPHDQSKEATSARRSD